MSAISGNTAGCPDERGYFGNYGGAFVPPVLEGVLRGIREAYLELRVTGEFIDELRDLYLHYIGRPSPVYFAKNLTALVGGSSIYLKREDLNHTGAHKINHCMGEALVARRMGKTRLIAETGAGQHGVALATAAAITGLPCTIYMGTVDMEKERPNVTRMRLLGAEVVPVSRGLGTLKDAVDAAFEAYMEDPEGQFYAIGSVVGPDPFPMMVRDFQTVVGLEAREQFLEMTGGLPDCLVACVGGGSNAIGLFTAFLDDPGIDIYGVEPSGRGFRPGQHAATLTLGSPGLIHGFRCYLLQDEEGEPLPVYSVASGLDYPGVGPQHSHLKDTGRVRYETVSDSEAIEAFRVLSRVEGIIPALESAHAVAFSMELARRLGPGKSVLVNLSGRGDKDLDFVVDNYGL
ncbi:MAG: tryptophan synthase subunit beta [Candidatus Fermentibacteraceae bacterium]|nr:tryptophan synthase subunit beta [Candidatus Fermentibacteraceae bacterium]MBN2608585.1 tryptophan synthase subunit beta [Candidatus Fermentibacteraceae bacterium]